jgi:hypothetical protein
VGQLKLGPAAFCERIGTQGWRAQDRPHQAGTTTALEQDLAALAPLPPLLSGESIERYQMIGSSDPFRYRIKFGHRWLLARS